MLCQTASGFNVSPSQLCAVAPMIHRTSYMKTHSDHSGRVYPPASRYDGTSLMSASGGIAHDPCDPTGTTR